MGVAPAQSASSGIPSISMLEETRTAPTTGASEWGRITPL